jgi:hypothetical protein
VTTAVPLAVLPAGPVASMGAAVARMRTIASLLPVSDGLACFNRMYLLVTEAVRAHVHAGSFHDPAFMSALDVDFANRYLAAIDGCRARPTSAPRCWSALIEARHDVSIAPMQFALAGLNAHVNYDLAAAVVSTCQAMHTEPDASTHHADYESVNAILDSLDQRVRESFEQGEIAELDRRFAGLENLVGNFSLTAARTTAWVNARVLWRLREEAMLFDRYLDGMDCFVAFAGRGLLLPLHIE